MGKEHLTFRRRRAKAARAVNAGARTHQTVPTLKLEIDTTDRALVDDLLEGRYDADPQRVVAVPGNAELRIDHLVKRFAVEVPETIVVLLDIGKDVAIG